MSQWQQPGVPGQLPPPYAAPPAWYGSPGAWVPPRNTEERLPIGWMVVGLVFRALIAALAWWSFFSVLRGIPSEYVVLQILQFSVLQVLLAALLATFSVLRPIVPLGSLRRRFEGRVGWIRGMFTTNSVCTMLVFGLLMGGFSDPNLDWNVLHFVIPTLLLVDILAFGQNQERLPWWMPLAWLLPMLAYFAYALIRAGAGQPLYSFLDPSDNEFIAMVAVLFIGWVIVGYIVLGLGRLRGAIRRAAMPPVPPQPQWGPPRGPFPQPQWGPFPQPPPGPGRW